MNFGFSTLGCPEWQWADILAAASDLGYNGLELRGINKEIYLPHSRIFKPESLADKKAELKRLSLSLACLATGAYLFDYTLRQQARQETLDYITLAEKMGVPFVRVLCDRDPAPGVVDREVIVDNLQALLPVAKEAGVTLLVETNGVFAQTEKLKELCDELNHPALGILWDIHHPYRFFGEPPEVSYQNVAKYLRHVHIKDSVMNNGNVEYRMYGYGDVPVHEAVKLLKKNNYSGFVMLEWVRRWNINLEEPGIVLPQFINAVSTNITK